MEKGIMHMFAVIFGRVLKAIVHALKVIALSLLVLLILDFGLFYVVGFTINPIDQWIFVVMLHTPLDFYVPEAVVPIEEGKEVYEFEYTHRYSGWHAILLNIVREEHTGETSFRFPDGTIEVEIEILHPLMKSIKQSWSCSERIDYIGTITALPLLRYESTYDYIDKLPYKVKLTVNGQIDGLLKMHPKSYWSVRNDTNK